MPISQRSFGVTVEGREVILYTLSNDHGMRIEVMNYGGIIRAIEVPDRNGKQADITLGFDTLEPYLGRHPFFGRTTCTEESVGLIRKSGNQKFFRMSKPAA